jgi:flagellar protein FlaG
MALDISSIHGSSKIVLETARPGSAVTHDPRAAAEAARASVATLAQDLVGAEAQANRRLSFSFNTKLDEVVVKVIDSDTDKVVREIPPVELQHVYERIREVVGLLFDRRA